MTLRTHQRCLSCWDEGDGRAYIQLTMESRRSQSSDSEDYDIDLAYTEKSVLNATAQNEPDTNATLSQRVFHAAKDGMALTLFALLADQARPQQVHDST